ncbi:MAG: toast rack family protein, partial [Actinomycetota bacterium]|nr:toast rack family protein [Actinomycetota bacterium]
MERSVVLFIAAVAAALIAGACGPQRVEVGELRTESRSVEPENADSVRANLRIGLGELNLTGGADSLMEAEFAYNIAAWRPGVSYEMVGDTGELTVVQRGLGEGLPGPDVRNEWDVRLNDAMPMDLGVQMGGGVSNLDLDSLTLTGLNLDVGAGATTVDLTGDWERDLSAVV